MSLDTYGCTWPTLEEFRTLLDVDPDSTIHDSDISAILASGIAQVKNDVGAWDDMLDIPDCALKAAALRMAWLMAQSPQAAAAASADPTYAHHLRGHRRRFAIS
jgi:hypothetical protein